MMTVSDQITRDRALDIRHSFAVSAPAGSGKTGLLVRRILKLLATCDSPEQVLAITFTRKAAAEMQERIIDALNRACVEQPPADEYERAIWEDARQVIIRDREKNWQLVATPSRLRIMTIDSLCRNIARQMAVETTLGDLPEPTDQPAVYYREAIRQFFKQLEQPGTTGDALATLLGHLDNNLATLENLLESLLAKREQWLGPLLASRDRREILEQGLRNTVQESLAVLKGSLGIVESDLAMLADYAGTNLKQYNNDSPIRDLAGLSELPGAAATEKNLDRWLALSELLLTKSDAWRSPKGISRTQGFPTPKESVDPDNAQLRKDQLIEVLARLSSEPGLLQSLTDLRNLPGIVYSDTQWQLLDALTLILPLLVAELSVLFKSRHTCDFTEVTLAALAALGSEDNVTDISLRLDYQIKHILVDEFQDTSSLQFRLLKLLTQGWLPDDGRTLFVVGDGMQSLYGFRNANVGIFLEARKLPIGHIRLEPLDLQVNFRSDPTLVNWVNQCFRGIFPAREDVSRGAVAYSPAVPAKSAESNNGVTVDVFDKESTGDDEGRHVVELIKRARQSDPVGTIAVLVRARPHLNDIIPRLREANIPWEASDIDPLSSRMPVIDLHSLTRALLNPADRIAWLAVLRAPWCGLSLRDLHSLTTAGVEVDGPPDNLPWLGGQLFSPHSREDLSADGSQRLERIRPILYSAWQQRFRKPLRQWVEGAWLALGGPATLFNDDELAWCQQYLDLLEKHSVGATIRDMGQFTSSLASLFANPVSTGDNPVQIMTVHKAKGLEFDTVILPSLHKGSGIASSELLYWRERINACGEAELLISPLLSPLEEDNLSESRLVKHLKYESGLKGGLEDARVFYVACTRAIKRLHLLYREPDKNPAKGSLLACFQPALEYSDGAGAHHRRHGQPLPENNTETADRLTVISRLKTTWRHPFINQLTSSASNPFENYLSKPEFPAGDFARHVGTVLHRTLSLIVRDGIAKWDTQRIQRQQTVWQIQLCQLGITNTELAISSLGKAVNNMLADDTGRWLLSAHHQDGACELALGHREGDSTTISVVDRTFIDGGIRWIVDYKSSEPQDRESLPEFFQRECSRYREQLDRYRSVFCRMEPENNIKTALYFPLLAHLEVVG